MLETPHVVVGAAIATKVVNPALAIPLAFASHFVLEKVPHWNPHLNTETKKYGAPTKESTRIVIVDSTTALVLGGGIAMSFYPNIVMVATVLASCLASVLPDIIEAPYFFLKQRSETIKKWIAWQKSIQVDTSPVPGLLTQFLTIGAALWWIFISP